MQTSTSENSTVQEQRSLLYSYLQARRSSLIAASKRLCDVDTRMNLLTELFLYDFTDLLLASILRDDWERSASWIHHLQAEGDELHHQQRCMSAVLEVIAKESEDALPPYSVLLGTIRLRFTELHRLMETHPPLLPLQRHKDTHDPQGVAIDTILMNLDARDPATAEHSRAVSSWSRRIACQMSLSESIIEHVTRGGLVHDLGKTTTPLEILNAPRKLSAGEWAIMQHHVLAGWQMIAELPILAEFSSIVRNHHERYEGGGYPDNLQGTAIPLSTRIVSVADAFNAMIGRRPYRVPLSPLEAILELRRFRGSQFDPDVTDAMTELVTTRRCGLSEGLTR